MTTIALNILAALAIAGPADLRPAHESPSIGATAALAAAPGIQEDSMRTIRVRTTHGQEFRRAGIVFGPDAIEVKIGDRHDSAQRIITEEDLQQLLQAARPYMVENPDEARRQDEPMVRSGSVLSVEDERGRPLYPPGDKPPGDRPAGPTPAAGGSAQVPAPPAGDEDRDTKEREPRSPRDKTAR